jgi:hypothetical protein
MWRLSLLLLAALCALAAAQVAISPDGIPVRMGW